MGGGEGMTTALAKAAFVAFSRSCHASLSLCFDSFAKYHFSKS